MNVSSGQSTGSYGNRTVAIEVSGLCNMDINRTSSYTIKVPFSRMSSAMQSINHSGAKVVGVSVLGTGSSADSSTTPSSEAD